LASVMVDAGASCGKGPMAMTPNVMTG
jgi:hypothetical protein